MDRILLPAIPLRARVGVTDEERSAEQDVLIDLELGLELVRAGKSDAIEDTVDYDQVCEVLASTMRARSFRLIEAIAEACAAAVLGTFPLDEVRVRVRKPGALKGRGVPWAGVEIVRRRA